MARTFLHRDPNDRHTVPAAELEAAFDALLTELKVPQEFSPEALAEAESAAAAPLPQAPDRSDLPFVTIDPAGSMDLDQAMCLERNGDGYRVYYAIADVPSFVQPGGALDAATRERGQTLYAPHRRVPLHPPVLSEGAASLLPEQLRPALVWTIDLDSSGATTAASVQRCLVRSRARYDYASVQQAFDEGNPPEPFALLKPIGELLIAAEIARGGASLQVPDQEIDATAEGYQLVFRPQVPVEQWNAQISLLTGRAAADIMIAGKVGVLRTMPGPDQATIDTLRRRSLALGVPWPDGQPYQEWLRGLNPSGPKQLALAHASAALFRGASYTSFDGELPDQTIQAAVADEYAHVTAPLRRLVDRFGLAICEALCRGAEPPQWARAALPELPELMVASDRAASELERAAIDLAEAILLQNRVGEIFDGVIVSVREGRDGAPSRGLVQLIDPAVTGPIEGVDDLGAPVRVRLESVDLAKRSVKFALA